MEERRKRNRNDRGYKPSKPHENEMEQAVDENSPVIQMFRGFQQELDERHDKYEKVVKLSRDITIESKRIIFLLHRVSNTEDAAETLSQADEKLSSLENTKFLEVAKELVNTDLFQFLRAYSPGLQEYIEALTFYFYLKDNKLIPLEEVQARLTFKVGDKTEIEPTEKDSTDQKENQEKMEDDTVAHPGTSVEQFTYITVHVPASEYILGVADLTGEMMRKAINCVGSGDLDKPFDICKFLQEIEVAYSSLGNANREVYRKLYTLRQSLRKVETACYTLKVRGSEIPKHMLVDMITTPNLSQFNIDDSLVTEDD